MISMKRHSSTFMQSHYLHLCKISNAKQFPCFHAECVKFSHCLCFVERIKQTLGHEAQVKFAITLHRRFSNCKGTASHRSARANKPRSKADARCSKKSFPYVGGIMQVR